MLGFIQPDQILPVEIVLSPEWWYHHTGICFDQDFFFHPKRRVEVEQKMEQVLYERFGQFGLGEDHNIPLPVIGAVHLAAGFLVSEMLGCRVEYRVDAPPQVIPAQIEDISRFDSESAFHSNAFLKLERLVETLKTSFGYVVGDVNWGGVLNIALDLRGQYLFMDMFDKPEQVKSFFNGIATVLERFTHYIQNQTGTSSISVNRNVRHFMQPILLHSECSHTMISTEDYKRFLFDIDARWATQHTPYGIHYCGPDPHRFAAAFSQLPRLDFLDVGWGGDVKTLRQYLPNTFFNLRLSPVEIVNQTPDQIRQTIISLVNDSGDPTKTGVCCINMDQNVSDEKIKVIFQTVAQLRQTIQKS